MGVGSGAAGLPSTAAEARAAYDETVRKCAQLGVNATRNECLREAQRVLDQQLARLKAQQRASDASQ